MKKWIQVSLHVLFGLLLGSFLSLVYISYHDVSKVYIKDKLVEIFERDYDCKFDGKIEQINLLSLSFRLRNMTITPTDNSGGDWFIYAHQVSMNVSWFSLLLDRLFLLRGKIEQLVMHETFEHAPHKLSEFLQKASTGPGSEYILYDTLSIVDGVVSFSDMQNKVRCHCSYTANIAQDNEFIQSHIHVNDGYALIGGHQCAEKINGNIRCKIPYQMDINNLYLHTNLQVKLPDLVDYEEVVLFGEFDEGKGRFSIENKNGLFNINDIQVDYLKEKFLSSLLLVVTPKLLNVVGVPQSLQKNIKGNCSLLVTADLYNFFETLKADLYIDKIVYNDLELFHDFVVSLQNEDDHYVGEILVADSVISGPIYFDGKSFSADLVNLQEVSLFDGRWEVDVGNVSLKIAIDEQSQVKGSYDLLAKHKYRADPVHISGSLFADQEKMKLKGKLDDKEYEVSCSQSPFYLHQLIVKNEVKELLHFYADEKNKNKVLGFVDFDHIQAWASPTWKPSFTQEGKFLFEGEIKSGVYFAHIHTHDAHIRIPKVYNVVDSFNASAEIDLYNRTASLRDVSCHLYDGNISCKQARVVFDETGKISFVHAPLLFKDVMLSGHKGIFSTFSGKMHCEKREGNPFLLSGFLVADRSQLKGNILSKEFQDQVIGSVDYSPSAQTDFDCLFDIHMMTKDGVDVQTSFINTDLRGKFDLTGSFQKPQLEGVINLHGGSFAFPYKSLEIMRGKISFLPGPTFDPLIDVVARGKLKRYEVTMRVSGSMYDQKISFESVPYLEEQQILGLLLAGSEESSFNVAAPAFLMQSFKDLVFGPAISKSNLNKLFDTLLKPLKGVRFIPQFTNQTGRGGMRLTVEADVTEKLSGQLSSNFMQMEDSQVEVNYAANDEITFRALADGQRSIGGEVEMRWKFN